jgi:hypothetical protein
VIVYCQVVASSRATLMLADALAASHPPASGAPSLPARPTKQGSWCVRIAKTIDMTAGGSVTIA